MVQLNMSHRAVGVVLNQLMTLSCKVSAQHSHFVTTTVTDSYIILHYMRVELFFVSVNQPSFPELGCIHIDMGTSICVWIIVNSGNRSH